MGRLGPPWGDLEPCWAGLGATMGRSSAILDHLGFVWVPLETMFGHLEPKALNITTVSSFLWDFGTILDHFGAILPPS